MIVTIFHIVKSFLEGSSFSPDLGVFHLNSCVVVTVSIPYFYFFVILIFIEMKSWEWRI